MQSCQAKEKRDSRRRYGESLRQRTHMWLTIMLTTFSAVAPNNGAAASKLERQSPTGQYTPTWMHSFALGVLQPVRRSNTYNKMGGLNQNDYKGNLGKTKTKTKRNTRNGRATVTICCRILTILPFNVAQAVARGDVDAEGRKMIAPGCARAAMETLRHNEKLSS